MSSRTRWRFVSLLLAPLLVTQGCVAVHVPLQRNEGYPAEWSGVSALGPECKDIPGTYSNEGVLAFRNGITQTVSQEGALIAKVQNYHADVILAVPIFGKTEPWVRFRGADDRG